MKVQNTECELPGGQEVLQICFQTRLQVKMSYLPPKAKPLPQTLLQSSVWTSEASEVVELS